MDGVEYVANLEATNKVLMERLESSDLIKDRALAFICLVREKYKLLKNTGDDYEYWGRKAEFDSLMKYDGWNLASGSISPEQRGMYMEARSSADEFAFKDTFRQHIEKDLLDLLNMLHSQAGHTKI
jgi:hypothetical protein